MKQSRVMIFLFAITTACTLVLSLGHLAYLRAANVFNVRLYATILELFEIPAEEQDTERVFLENFTIAERGATTYYTAKRKHAGTVVFKTDGPGLWSQIELLLAVEPNRQSLLGLRVLSQAETPGLGGRIGEAEFQTRFAGADIRPKLKLVKFAMADNEVDAISGATKTSEAVQAIINRGVVQMDQAHGEGGEG